MSLTVAPWGWPKSHCTTQLTDTKDVIVRQVWDQIVLFFSLFFRVGAERARVWDGWLAGMVGSVIHAPQRAGDVGGQFWSMLLYERVAAAA